jgi:hypothetical protein
LPVIEMTTSVSMTISRELVPSCSQGKSRPVSSLRVLTIR